MKSPKGPRQDRNNDAEPPQAPLSEEETSRLNRKIGEESRRQAEVGRTVRGDG